jgi:hypothetical protein
VTEKPWRIREYESGDEDRIVPFFNQVFAEYDGFEPRGVRLWKWKFEEHPLGHHTFIAEDDNGAMIGNFAGLRTPYLFRGERRIGSQGVDVCIRKDYRGTGLYVELASAYFQRFDDPREDFIAFGYPNPPSYKVVTRYLSYVPVHCPIFKLVHPVDGPWVEDMSRRAEGSAVEELRRFDDRVDRLWNRLRGGYEFATWRDPQYLRWRYERHPAIRYRYLGIVDGAGELEGLLVVCSGWFGQRVMPLVEWLVPRADRRVITTLVAGAARIAAGESLERLETWLPPASRERENLQALGFTDEEVPFNLVVRHSHDLFRVDWAKEHWFYTMGDTDFY